MFAKTLELQGINGVGLFFLLSSYLITELLTREKATSGDIHLKMFYIRRLLRIWPLYFTIVLIGILIQPLRQEFKLTVGFLVSYLFFFNNWMVMLHGFMNTPISPLWTVSAEEQFYLVWPLGQKTLSRKWLIGVCMVLVVAFPAIAYRTSSYAWHQKTTDQISALLFFPLGGLLAMLLKDRAGSFPRWKALGYMLLGLTC